LYTSLYKREDRDKLLAPDAPVFIRGVDGVPLRREDVNLVLELSAKELYGADNSKLFRSHSLRHGGASAYAAAGVPLHVIKEFGRWKSEAYMVYITLSVDVLDLHVRKAQAQALVLEERK
jgi:integrase